MSREMTNSEAIANLNHIYGMVSPNIQRSLDVAFKALEEKPTVSFEINPDYVTELQEHNKELIKQLEEVERPQSEWIPVSERLPKENGWYICTCRDICENRVHTVGFDGVRKKWGRGGVIAWQPLPEPYKGGADMRKPNCVTCDHFGKCEGCEKGDEE